MDFKNYLKFQKTGQRVAIFLEHRPGRNLMILFFLLLIYSLIIFGVYAVGSPATTESTAGLEINNGLYQKVISRLKSRDANIQQGIGQSYPDIFK